MNFKLFLGPNSNLEHSKGHSRIGFLQLFGFPNSYYAKLFLRGLIPLVAFSTSFRIVTWTFPTELGKQTRLSYQWDVH